MVSPAVLNNHTNVSVPAGASVVHRPTARPIFSSSPIRLLKVFFTEFYFLRCVAATEHPRAHSGAPAQERFLHAPALLTRVLLRPRLFCQALFAIFFKKTTFLFYEYPRIYEGNAQIKIFHALPQI